MNTKMPKMPGLWIPRLVPLTRGFVAGRTGVAALDESGELNSPYLTRWTARFYEYCHWYVIRLEKNSASLRTEAEALLQELEELPTGEVEGAAPEGPA
ncbi:MAG: hypothetical protein LUE31_08000, partial [Lachnospiraceae bacterium]|nr:hypothetical protein [Lachnospiraceae bacterium]